MKPLDKKEQLIKNFKAKRIENAGETKLFNHLGITFLPETIKHFRRE